MSKLLKIYKIGGGIINKKQELLPFLENFSKISGNKILVHGGGKIASEWLQKMGIGPKMIQGRRITDAQTLEVVTSLYAGLINKEIVAHLQKYNVNALGLCGADGNSIQAVKRPVKEIDYGFVGDISSEGINKNFFQTLISQSFVPVMSAITHDKNGQLLNTNADTIAASLAIALSQIFEVELHYCFDKNGVLSDINDENSVIPIITKEKYEDLKSEGIVNEGMIPKLDNAFSSIQKGVKKVFLEHALNINNEIKTVLC